MTDTAAAADAVPMQAGHTDARFWALTLGAIGVVYGDIGTSPLYAFREALLAVGGSAGSVQAHHVLGLLSLILWALTIIVTLKYVLVLLHADNQGEGGTLALLALAQRALGRSTTGLVVLGCIGAALFFGDAIITPAISVLSAVEGLKLVTTRLEHAIVPLTIVIIIGLFLVQSRGTAAVAAWFGPIVIVWFVVMALGGLVHIAGNLSVLAAINPLHALRFVTGNGVIGLIALGAVFLAVTGAEALYADLGHFGRGPIQIAWIGLVFPALAINYLGQGALVLANPAALENPFFLLYPDWALLPVVVLATLATIIASQAVITGAYSLTQQAMRLRLLSRLRIMHTSEEQAGQIYMPAVNTFLMVGVLALVVVFGSSSKLASAYGIAVTGTMVVTAILALIVVWRVWRWPIWAAAALIVPLIAIDLVFLGANLMKILDGGYVPLLMAGGVGVIMWTWIRGSEKLGALDRQSEIPLTDLLRMLEHSRPATIAGTAIYLTANPGFAPVSLMHALKHFRSLHEQNVILTVVTANRPRVDRPERMRAERINTRFWRITMTFGFMEEPDLPRELEACEIEGWTFNLMTTSFLVSRRSILPAVRGDLPAWQSRLFIFLARNATDASSYFHIPPGRVVEIGSQVTL